MKRLVFALSATSLCLVRYICLGKDDFCHNYFKLVHAQTLDIPYCIVRDVFIYTQSQTFGIYIFCAI